MPKLNQKRSQTAHTASGHSNKVNPVMLTGEERGKSIATRNQRARCVLKSGLHRSYISPSWWPRGQPHLSRQVCTIRSHLLNPLWVLDQLTDLAREQFARDL